MRNVSKTSYDTAQLVDKLGFTIHPTKSILEPNIKIIFLGFLINSQNMTIRITEEKATELANLCKHLSHKVEISLREFARVIGKMVASEPGIEHAPIYYKVLEIEKDKLLKLNYGNFDVKI